MEIGEMRYKREDMLRVMGYGLWIMDDNITIQQCSNSTIPLLPAWPYTGLTVYYNRKISMYLTLSTLPAPPAFHIFIIFAA